ncbi:MAG: hypothetical protein AAFR59_00705 [Bacteroidota bacterium]
MLRYFAIGTLCLWLMEVSALGEYRRWESTASHVRLDTPRHAENHEVWIDHDLRQVVIRAWYSAAHNHPQAWRQLQFALTFWNSQSGQFGLQIKSEGRRMVYPIRFDLRIPDGTYTESGFYVPHQNVSAQFLTQVEVLPATKMPVLRASHNPVAGYAPANFIYISELHAENKWIGPHEVGHRLGSHHIEGTIMDHNLLDIRPVVNTRIVQDIVETQLPVLWKKKGWKVIRLR